LWSENLKGRDYKEDIGIDGKIILDWILGKQRGRVRIGCVCLRVGTSAGPL